MKTFKKLFISQLQTHNKARYSVGDASTIKSQSHLRLVKKDVVIDQAIYAKAVEVLENLIHKDLKDFIVLQMGGLCIAMTFLGDCGMKHLLVESAIFGMLSLLI